jgi:hypothetical protein
MRRGSSFLLGAALGLSGATVLVASLAAHGCGDQDTAGTGTIVGTGGSAGTGGGRGSGASGSTGAAGGAGASGGAAPDAGDAGTDGDGGVDDGGDGGDGGAGCAGELGADFGCDGGIDAGGADGGEIVVTLHPDAGPLPGESTCTVVETTGTPIPCRFHLPICTPIRYPTNPPSGGDHWPLWAAYRKYTQTVVPREMFVHDEEHGAIVLLYRCAGACPEVVAALSSVFDAFPPDPLCTSPGPPARLVLTADPDLPTPIAAAAWGATYTATCIDTDSLTQFMLDHYAQGPEDFCSDGVDVDGTVGACADAGLGSCY